ncbi:hypothetical protein [Streptomyces sp. 2A115]|uniref:hypothetical protein n=1 Tax=Streptomyces sp. 2A115 TaxID=3457439 RepID=UPI003FD287EA
MTRHDMVTRAGAEGPADFWEAVAGREFAAALNEGLTRSAARRLHAQAGSIPVGQERTDPFEAAVIASYVAALPAALYPRERRDPALRSALLRRGRQVMAEALALVGHSGGPRAHREMTALLPEHETVVVTLLMECVALVVLEGRSLEGALPEPADLVRALGCCARARPAPFRDPAGSPGPN